MARAATPGAPRVPVTVAPGGRAVREATAAAVVLLAMGRCPVRTASPVSGALAVPVVTVALVQSAGSVEPAEMAVRAVSAVLVSTVMIPILTGCPVTMVGLGGPAASGATLAAAAVVLERPAMAATVARAAPEAMVPTVLTSRAFPLVAGAVEAMEGLVVLAATTAWAGVTEVTEAPPVAVATAAREATGTWPMSAAPAVSGVMVALAAPGAPPVAVVATAVWVGRVQMAGTVGMPVLAEIPQQVVRAGMEATGAPVAVVVPPVPGVALAGAAAQLGMVAPQVAGRMAAMTVEMPEAREMGVPAVTGASV